ncbi:hypothetical protein CK501_12630 [Halovibrio salipaludis]|uniref:DUF962 domain-containing protein n=1 Tax=Halovibrio salipaludis TaxID=2032626 RepID=A0A2A2F2H3_9GAMM|nr:hypothetical protein [Halovibrio salipaludis]PAU79646.1 hypothetical protein CK501_12630 [Halovibrio salipaludis]
MINILRELEEQRWDDHRYYHQSRINQSLHLVSAFSFLTAYFYLAINPMVSAFMGWGVAMMSRQIGHFFFEPHDYDKVNHVSHSYKEEIKVGYNLKRKVVLLSVWALTPVALWMNPGFFGLLEAQTSWNGYFYNLSLIWIALGMAALLFRTVQLFFIRDVPTGVIWLLKIITDPFNDIRMYYRSPFYLMRGQLIDPMDDLDPPHAETEHANH